MSEEPKKYPPDTPLTMGLLIEIYDSNGKKGNADFWRKQIEPPKPEPKEGELWLCKVETGRMTAVWRLSGGWCYWSDGVGTSGLELTPIKRVLPPEDSDE